ncbi:MAG TPA: hypothetical protein VGZ02_11690 [Candidatus Baltobacteraceae bacterium]|nr:hypothetical protein [Candidatus Baltobacteraceae bacterium]
MNRSFTLNAAYFLAALFAIGAGGCSATNAPATLPVQTNSVTHTAQSAQTGTPALHAFTAGVTPGFLSTAHAWDIAPGPNDSVWFTDTGTPAIGSIEAGTVREYTGLPANARPYSIVVAPNRMAWFTDSGTASIGRISPAGVVKEFSNPRLSGSFPQDVTIAPDGSVWFIAVGTTAFLAHVDRADRVHAAALPSTLSPDGSLIADKSGSLWFLATNANQKAVLVQRLTDGTLVRHPTELSAAAEPCCPNLAPKRLTIGPDGNVWFTTLNYIKESSPANWIVTAAAPALQYFYVHDGSITYSVYPSGITASGTKLWFTGDDPFQLNGGLWSMKTDGAMVAYPVNYNPAGLTTATDGSLWFTSDFGGQPSAIVHAIIK